MLRDYQEDIVKDILSSDDNVVAVLPTGGGKSFLIQQIVLRDRKQKYAVVIRNAPLVKQLVDRLEEVGLRVGVVKAGYEYDNKSADDYDVLLLMEQTFNSRKHKLVLPNVDVILKDEFHIAYTGNQFTAIKDHLDPQRVIGLTATPITELGIAIHHTIGYRLINDVSTKTLISKKHLVKPVYKLPRNSTLSNIKKVKVTNGDYATGELDAILNTDEHNTFVVDEVMANCADRKALVFANSIAHVEALAEAFTARGIDVAYLHSKMSKEDIEVNMELYMTGAVRVMINMSILTTGFDDPATDCIVYVRPTKVLRLYLQIGGRGLRIKEGKEDCLVLDLAGVLDEHGFLETERSFNAKDKDEAEAEKMKNQIVNLDVMIVEGEEEISETTELKYKLYDRDKRMDALWNENQLLAMKVKQLETEHILLKDTQKEVTKLRATNNNISSRLQILSQESAAVAIRKSEIDGETARSKLEAVKITRETARLAVIQGTPEEEEDTELDKELTRLEGIVYGSRYSLRNKLQATAAAYQLLGRNYLTPADINNIQRAVKVSPCPYIGKSVETRMKKLIESEQDLDELFSFISWVEEQYKLNRQK